MSQSLRSWTIGTSAVCVVVLGLGGFLLVKPQLDEASGVREQTATLTASNDDLADEVAALREEFADIDTYRAQLQAARVRIPEAADLSAMLRQIDAVAAASGVTLVTSSPAAAQEWVPPTPAAEEPTDGATQDGAEGAEPTPSPSASPADADADADANAAGGSAGDALLQQLVAELTDVQGLYAIPVTVDVVGPYDAVRTFLSALQRNDGRYFFAGDFTLTRLDGSDASGGRPAVGPGDVELAMTASAFVLTPSEGASQVAPADPGAVPAPLPTAPDGKNPFAGGAAG